MCVSGIVGRSRPPGQASPGTVSLHRRIQDRLDSAYDWLERRTLSRRTKCAADETHGPFRMVCRWSTAVAPRHVEAVRVANVDVLIDLAPGGGSAPCRVPSGGLVETSLRCRGRWGTASNPHAAARGAAGLAESLLTIELPTGRTRRAEVGVSAFAGPVSSATAMPSIGDPPSFPHGAWPALPRARR